MWNASAVEQMRWKRIDDKDYDQILNLMLFSILLSNSED